MPQDDDYYAAETAERTARLPMILGALAIGLALTAGVVAVQADAEAKAVNDGEAALTKNIKALRAAMAELKNEPGTTESLAELREQLATSRRETLGKLKEIEAELGEYDRVLRHRWDAGQPTSGEAVTPVVRDDEAMLDK